jgi:sugar phosphate isomerase/epimerase
MARLAMSELTTLRWSFEEDVERFVAAGYDGIGVWRQKLADFGDERGIILLEEQPLAVSSLLWAGGFTGSDGRTHTDAVADAREAIRVAAAMKARCLVVHSGARGLHTLNHVRRLLLTAIDELLPLAEALRVTLALEPMQPGSGSEWTFLTDLDGACDLVARYRSPRLKLVLDCYEWGRDKGLAARLGDLVPHLALVQLADAGPPPAVEPCRLPLGTGTLPLAQLVGALAAGGYDGPFEAELMGAAVEDAGYEPLLAQTLAAFRGWTTSADAMEPALAVGQAGRAARG